MKDGLGKTCSARQWSHGKPVPDLFLYATQRLETAPEHCLVVEDSPAGIDAAGAAGMTAIGFCGGSHCGPDHGARLQDRGAALVIADMRELATALAKTRVSRDPEVPFSRQRISVINR